MSINNSIALHPIKWNWCFSIIFLVLGHDHDRRVQRCSKLQPLQFWPPHLRIVFYWIYIAFDFYFSSICIVHWIHALYIVQRAAQMFHKPVSTLFLSWVIPQTLWMINNPFIHQFHYGMFIFGSNAAFVSIGRFFTTIPFCPQIPEILKLLFCLGPSSCCLDRVQFKDSLRPIHKAARRKMQKRGWG